MLAWLYVLGKRPGFAQLMSKEYLPSVKSEFTGTKEIKSLLFFLMLWQLYQELVMRIFTPLHIEFAPNTMQYKYVGMVMSHTEETGQAIVFYTKWNFYQKIVQLNICQTSGLFPCWWFKWMACMNSHLISTPSSPPLFSSLFYPQQSSECLLHNFLKQARRKKNIKNTPEDTKNKLWDFLSLNKCLT